MRKHNDMCRYLHLDKHGSLQEGDETRVGVEYG